MKFKQPLVLFFILLVSFAKAQGVYQLSYKTDVPISTVGVAANIPPLFMKKNKPLLTEATINGLDKNKIWKVDRFATNYWNTRSAITSDVLMITSMALPILLLANRNTRSEGGKITLMYAETLVLNAGITNLTKEIFKRKRPYNYNPNAPLSKKMESDATSSFFSGHTSFSSASTFFFAKVYADTNPNSKWKPAVWTGAAVIPLTTAILRVAAGKHFPTDVLVGYLVGAATGILVPHLHKVNRAPSNVFPR
jgi:membrane-associated phospholipid phosphatase